VDDLRSAAQVASRHDLHAALEAVLRTCDDFDAIKSQTTSDRAALLIRAMVANALGVVPTHTPPMVVDQNLRELPRG
jgi:hypothetical protein